jgi:Bacteriophage minor capsid protein
MDIALVISTYLANAGFGTVGTSIFVGQIPSSIDGVYVIRSAGQMNNYLPVENTILDIYVKDSKSIEGVEKIENIKRYIHRMHNTTTSDTYIYSMLVLGDIESVERDAEYAKIYKVTVSVQHRPLSLIS